jgi:Putative Flp pilus-assembly TadE/G-like
MTAFMIRLKTSAKRLWADTDGVILPYVTIMLVVIVGVSVLAIDGARVTSLQTQLQRAADAYALAGAVELDGADGARDRATAAINTLVTNSTLPGMGNEEVAVASIRYLKSLPTEDLTAIDASHDAATDAEAKYVEVTAQPVALTNILPASFFGGPNTTTTGAQAVAGRGDLTICDVPPVYICNPYETPGNSDAAATALLLQNLDTENTATALERRRQWKLLNGKDGPGQFGWLFPPDECSGANCLRDWIARTKPNACYNKARVHLNTGAMSSVNDALNVRFDIYGGPLSYSPDYAPAVNVRRGFTKGGGKTPWCTPQARPTSPYPYNPATGVVTNGVGALGRDTGTWPLPHKGTGVWDCDRYWKYNHTAAAPTGCTTSATISRYDVYRYEIDHNLLNDWSGDRKPNGTGESGRPYCAGENNGVDVSTGGMDRRIIFAAIVNCVARGPFPGGNNAVDVPVAAFGKFFMTEPVGAADPSDPAVRGEFVGVAKLEDGVTLYATVQLYR